MVVILYYFPSSPPSRAVYMILKELGVKFEIKQVNMMAGEHKEEEYKKINPRGKVPSIVDGSLKLCESKAIAAYLCNKYAGRSKKSLYPTKAEERAVVDMMLYAGEWVVEKIFAFMNIGGVFEKGESTKKENLPGVKEALQFYEDRLNTSDFLAGKKLTLADIFGTVIVTFLELTDFDGFGEYPSVKKWLERMKKLPYYETCNAEGLKMFREFYTSKLETKKQTQF